MPSPAIARDRRRAEAAAIAGVFSFTWWSRLALILLSAGVAIVAGSGPASADDPHYFGCGSSSIDLPRTVSIGPGVDAALVRSAMDEWNRAFGTVFVEAPAGEVKIVADSTTWVEMPCATSQSVVHVGTDIDLNYWLAHELGHTLGLADHIRSSDNAARFINPGHCPDDGYDGIMSYCTPRSRWFGPDDIQMMQTLRAVFEAGPRRPLQIGTGLAPAAEAPAAPLPSNATAVEAVQPPLSTHGDTRRSFGDHVGSSPVWLSLLVLAVVSALAVRAGLPSSRLRAPAVSPREAADASIGVVLSPADERRRSVARRQFRRAIATKPP